jgi:D-apiose dehydrogenase
LKVFKGGLIGCGFFSQNHQEAWRRIANVEIVAASDLSLERAQAAAPHAYTSAKEMLQAEKLDFVDIATRSPTHLELVTLAAEKGVAIICQKPMAPDWETARRMVEICEERGVRAMVHDNWRWQSWYRAACAMITQGDIGTPLGYGFRCRVKEGTGPEPYPKQAYFRQLPRFMIDEVLVHHIDTARFLFGDIASIYAEGARRNPHIQAEDHVVLTLQHVHGAMGWIEGSSFLSHQDDARTLDEATFDGESGSLLVNGKGEIWAGDEKLWRDIGKGYRGDSVYSTQAHFIDRLETGRPFETGFRSYLEQTFAAVEAAYLSLASHCAVQIAEVVSGGKHASQG